MHVEFFERVGFVRFDGFNRNVEKFGDLFVAVAERDVAQNVGFAPCQLGAGGFAAIDELALFVVAELDALRRATN